MTTAQGTETVILTDDDGNYYMIPRVWLEGARLSAEEKEKVQRLEGADVEGFIATSSIQRAPQTNLFAPQLRSVGACRCSWNKFQSVSNPLR